MSRYHWIIWISVFGIIANISGVPIYGTSRSPDEFQGWRTVAGAFLIFLSYSAAQMAWGYHLTRLFKRSVQFWETFFWGSALFSILMGTLGFLPVVGEWSFFLWNNFLLFGLLSALALQARYPVPSHLKSSVSRPGKIVLVLGMGLLFFTLADASVPQAFWDSLWYHLTGPRLWFEYGRIHLPPTFPIAYTTGLWDYHFLWGQILLGGPEGGGLIAAQLFGQWSTVTAAAFCFLILYSLKDDLRISPVAILLGIVGSELFMVVRFAKNDWGSCLWGLAFLAFLLRKERLIYVGFAAGLCFSAKYTSAFFLFPLLAGVCWNQRKDLREIISLGASFGMASLPLLARNGLATGNPFFPALHTIFPTELLGPSWTNIVVYEGNTLRVHTLYRKISSLIVDSRIILGFPLLIFFPKKITFLTQILVESTLLSAFLFLIFTGERVEWRLTGPMLLLLCTFGAMGFELVARVFPPRFFIYLAPMLIALALWHSSVDWTTPKRIFRWVDPSMVVRQWVSGSSMAWIRLHVPLTEGVATLNEQRIYYLFPHQPIRAFDLPSVDQSLHTAQNANEVVQIFRREKIRFLVLSAEFLDLYYNRQVCDWMYQLSEKNPKAVVFRETYSRVLDLNLIPALKQFAMHE